MLMLVKLSQAILCYEISKLYKQIKISASFGYHSCLFFLFEEYKAFKNYHNNISWIN